MRTIITNTITMEANIMQIISYMHKMYVISIEIQKLIENIEEFNWRMETFD